MIKKLLKRNDYFPIFVLDSDLQGKESALDLISWCFSNGISTLSLFNFYEDLCMKAPLFHINNKWIWDFNYIQLSNIKMTQKRLFDICLAALLTPFALAMSLFIAIIIKTESRGPILFTQERKGAKDRVFKVYKFRTMAPHAEDSTKWPHIEEDLITRFGKFLRWTGLDEIPQLINIYKGEMSFVGARPARTFVAEMHVKSIPFFTVSYLLPPGITGWSQIHQGADSGYDTILERVKYNLYYVKHYSIFLDIYIFLKSIKLFFSFKKPPPTQSEVSEKTE
jgi:lipopolysaccharide/colanic/teichoic acid biosynthesis glycosyltransferase